MAEYIERERLRELLKDHYFPTDQEYESDRKWAVGFNAGLDKALHKIHYAPAADVAPVVHGCWKVGYTDKENKTTGVECSECSAFYELDLFDFGLCYNYCPNCGARMDGDG